MIAQLYLLSESLKYNGKDTECVLLKKMNAFVEDLKYIYKYREENRIMIDPAIYNVNIFFGKKLFDIIDLLERDGRNLLYSVLGNTSSQTDLKMEAIKNECLNHNQDNCSAILAFNTIENIVEEVIIVYDKQSWFDFRRKFLGKYPQDSDYFIEECKKYFENLFFHDNNKKSVNGYLSNFSIKIVKYLSDLNDDFKPFYEQNRNISNTNDLLKKFSVMHSHDEHASLQGNHEKKDMLTFTFNTQKICCEPHLKISKSDRYPKDPKDDYAVRIYFHFGLINVENGRILIGSIGPHI